VSKKFEAFIEFTGPKTIGFDDRMMRVVWVNDGTMIDQFQTFEDSKIDFIHNFERCPEG